MQKAGLARADMDLSTDDIQDMIIEALRSSLQKPIALSAQTNIVNDLGLDSAAVMDFVMDIEDRLDILIPLDKIAAVETIGDLAAVVARLKGEA